MSRRLRDGMNLGREGVRGIAGSCRSRCIVLSQFAGAADQLPGALVVNPFDLSQMSEALERALSHAACRATGASCGHDGAVAERTICPCGAIRSCVTLRNVATAASVTKKAVTRVTEAKRPARVSS